MGFFTNLFGSKVNDPILGELEYHEGTWRGELDWPNNEYPAGLFYHSKAKPDVLFRERVEHIKKTVQRLERQIQATCFEGWVAQKLSIEDRFVRIESSQDLWRLIQMTGLNLDDTPQVALIYSFKNEALSSACFHVALEGDKLDKVDVET